ncbi:MAG: transcription antitermination protein NusB [Muribaculaceae bacterium]|nr:transcription antitermination protein NusB [Muribaculaceae bacterium]
MINRILIRLKVVQILYSYLLTRNDFRIDAAPENPTRDKKFAYAVYLDMLLLIAQMSGIRTIRRDGSMPMVDTLPQLVSNRVGRALIEDDAVTGAATAAHGNIKLLDPLLQQLIDAIATSSAFRSYKKIKNPDLEDDVRLWATVLRTIIAGNTAVQDALRQSPNFTLAGLEKGIEQAAATLESYSHSRAAYLNATRTLDTSLAKARELYMSIFILIKELTAYQLQQLENAKEKYLATPEELNPDMRFVDNALAAAIEKDAELELFIKDNPVSWADDHTLLKRLMEEILKSDIYRNYMAAPAVSPELQARADCDLWRELLKNVIFRSDAFAEAMEDRSVFWNDDLLIMGTFVLKSIRQATVNPDGTVSLSLLPMYKDEEDAGFGARLFRYAVDYRSQYRSYIDACINAEQWDTERLAFMDIVIMTVAIAELVNFPEIPLAVTMNEYVEIANNYSTPKSGQFINGILFAITERLRTRGLLNK